MKKPILIGMNNPVSTRPGHELYPLPEGCTGNRLWRMLHSRTRASMRDYLECFERRNLVRGVEYDRTRARARALETWRELHDTNRTIVLLGRSVQEAFHFVARSEAGLFDCFGRDIPGLPPLLVHPQEAGGCTWRQIPHPSGRNLFYNDAKNREVVALLMEELYVNYHKNHGGTN